MPMSEYHTLTYIMYKEKEAKAAREKREEEMRKKEEERQQKEAARKADEEKSKRNATDIRGLIRLTQERASNTKNKPEESISSSPPPSSIPNISMEELEEMLEEEM